MLNTEWTNSKIDQLGESLRDAAFSAEVITRLNAYRASFLPAYEYVASRLRSLNYELSGRPAKSTTALVDKLRRQKSRLSQIQDIAGCRVVVADIRQQHFAMQAMEVYLDSPVVVDRRFSSSHGYRAIHLIANHHGRKVEVQLRTEFQHLWAEISERLSDEFGTEIKYGSGDSKVLSFLSNMSTAIEKFEREEISRMEFMDKFRIPSRGVGEQISFRSLDKKSKKQIRLYENSFFKNRNQFLQLIRDAHADFTRVGAT